MAKALTLEKIKALDAEREKLQVGRNERIIKIKADIAKLQEDENTAIAVGDLEAARSTRIKRRAYEDDLDLLEQMINARQYGDEDLLQAFLSCKEGIDKKMGKLMADYAAAKEALFESYKELREGAAEAGMIWTELANRLRDHRPDPYFPRIVGPTEGADSILRFLGYGYTDKIYSLPPLNTNIFGG